MLRVLGEQFKDSYSPIRAFSEDIGESAATIDSKLEFAFLARCSHYENATFPGRKFILIGKN